MENPNDTYPLTQPEVDRLLEFHKPCKRSAEDDRHAIMAANYATDYMDAVDLLLLEIKRLRPDLNV